MQKHSGSAALVSGHKSLPVILISHTLKLSHDIPKQQQPSRAQPQCRRHSSTSGPKVSIGDVSSEVVVDGNPHLVPRGYTSDDVVR